MKLRQKTEKLKQCIDTKQCKDDVLKKAVVTEPSMDL